MSFFSKTSQYMEHQMWVALLRSVVKPRWEIKILQWNADSINSFAASQISINSLLKAYVRVIYNLDSLYNNLSYCTKYLNIHA